MFDLTGFQRDALFIISSAKGTTDGPIGLDIKKMLSEYYNGNVNHGRLYPNLNQLVEMGYVEKGEVDKRTNYYKITDSGEEALEEHLDWETTMLEMTDNKPSREDTNKAET